MKRAFLKDALAIMSGLLLGNAAAFGQFAILHSFTGGGDGPGVDLFQGSDGILYGTTGLNGGAVFKISASGSLTTLHSNAGSNGGNFNSGLAQGLDGSFYGTMLDSGFQHYGSVFKITSSGSQTTLHFFTGDDGSFPEAGLIRGTDGNFYGTTCEGGRYAAGTVFKITTSGSLTTLHSFTGGDDGDRPEAALIQGADGSFYGTTSAGSGKSDFGTIFKITASGSLTTLHSFTNYTSGAEPEASLVQGSDGRFYGTTKSGGSVDGGGVIFKITSNGLLTILHSFERKSGTGEGDFYAPDGEAPRGALIQGTDGSFYGITMAGGIGYGGTIFRISSSGSFTTLHSFTGDCSHPLCLIRGIDGNFYGITSSGAHSHGMIFKFRPE